MLECVDEKVPFADFMLSQDLDLEQFIDKTEEELREYTIPDSAIDVIEWLADRDASIAERRPRIYRDLIRSTLENWAIDDEERLEVVQRLVGLGATIDDRVIDAMDDLMSDCGSPEHVVDILEWIAQGNPVIA